MKTLSEIKAEVDRLAALIGASGRRWLPGYGPDGGGFPHIEVDDRGYHLVFAERKGSELSRSTTFDLDDILYHVFQHVIYHEARLYELEHRIESQDIRRVQHQRQIELFSLLSPQWAEHHKQWQEQFLRRYPLDDLRLMRAKFVKELRNNGIKAGKAHQMARERYPLPAKNETELLPNEVNPQ